MKMTWVDSPIPTREKWARPEEGGIHPPELETGNIVWCLNGHQWWERVSSPDFCPACWDYHIQHQKANPFRWAWHLLRESRRGTPVVTVTQYWERRQEDGNKEDQEEEAQ